MKNNPTERLSFRVKKDLKDILWLAADIMGQPLSDFVINAAVSNAERILKKNHEKLK